jgi:hypothetical protein
MPGHAPNNSFKPTPCRGVGRVLYATLARTRRPATGRLNSGVRRQKGVWWLCFPMLPSPASVGVALRCVSRHVASSVRSVWRAHTSRTLRWWASETVFSVVSFPTTDAVASETSGERFSGARSGLPASAFGNCAKVSLSPASFAPNKSFKPTPHRGVNSVLYATLHAVATPPWGGLTPALGGRKAFDCFAFQCSLSRLRLAPLFGQVVGALLLRLLLQTRPHITCVELVGFGNGD